MAERRMSFHDLASANEIKGIPTGERTTIIVGTPSVSLLEMEDENFNFDSAVMLPDPQCTSDSSVDPQDRITGLAVMRAVYQRAQDHPEEKLLIAGHTDTAGTPGYNLTLSQLRADNVRAVLAGDRDGFVGVANQRHKVEDYQGILKFVAATFGWSCDPGAVDGVHGPATDRAIRGFQQRYNAELDKNIAVDGKLGPDTWGAFFDVYALELQALLKTDAAGLASAQSSLQFLDASKPAVGCGESHPIDQIGTDDLPDRTNRRVEILFFPPGSEPHLDCHPQRGTCNPGACEIYDRGLYRFEHLPCQPGAGLGSQVSWTALPPADSDESSVSLVVTGADGAELARKALSSGDSGPGGARTFDLSDLPQDQVWLVKLEGDGGAPASGTRRVNVPQLRRALAQQDPASAGQQVALADAPGDTGALGGNDASIGQQRGVADGNEPMPSGSGGVTG